MTEAANDTPGGGGPALVYCRVSTKSLAEGTSLESQRAACAAHAEGLGYGVARVTLEVSSGADLFDRPLLSRDRADIRLGRFRALVAYSVDRLTRDAAHLAILADVCDRHGCRVLFAADGTVEDVPPLPDEAHAACVERRKIIERTTRGHRAKLLSGRPAFNGWPLYGYRPDRGAGVYTVYEPEATVVRRVFALCAGGRGMHSIASAFNREGLPSPKSAMRPGAKWTSGAISLLLSERSYAGEEVRLRAKRGPDGRDRPRPESERVRLPDGVRPPIVTRELWDECRRLIRERAAGMNNKREYPTLLRSHIFCAECGSGMIRNHFRRGKYEYLKYRCGSRWRAFETGCRGRAVLVEAAHEWAWGEVKSLLLSPGLVERAIEEAERENPAVQLLADDMESAKRMLCRAECVLRALASCEEPPGNNTYLGPHVERAEGERQRFEEVVAELEGRVSVAGRRASDLRRLRDICAPAGGDLDRLTFDERRLAVEALGFKAYANGDDPSGWRYEAGVPL